MHIRNIPLAPITHDRYMKEQVIAIECLNKTVKFSINNTTTLNIPKICRRTPQVVDFSASSFSYNHDFGSSAAFQTIKVTL